MGGTFMKLLFTRKLLGAAALILLLVLTVSSEALGQGRGRGRGRGGFDNFENRKCGKFVNCHDARDGRWDGRGPRTSRARFANVFGRSRRDRNRNWEYNRNWRHRR